MEIKLKAKGWRARGAFNGENKKSLCFMKRVLGEAFEKCFHIPECF